MVIVGHDNYGLFATWEIPEARQRFAVGVHGADHIRQQPLLLVGLWDGHLCEIDPVRLVAAIEQIIRANYAVGDCRVAVLSSPIGVTLARIHNRPRQVERPGCRLPAIAADTA